MPRVTRAALRNNVVAEDADPAATTPSPNTPLSKPIAERKPLGEIAGNSEDAAGPVKKTAGKKKGKGGRKPKKENLTLNVLENAENVEVIEDDRQSSASSAVEEACQDLLKDSNGGKPASL